MLRLIRQLKDYVLCALTLGTGPMAMWSILWKETKNIRVRLKLESHRAHEIYCLYTIYGPLYFRDNFGDITNLTNIFYRQAYRLRRLSHEGVILDVGANIGLAAKWFAAHNPGRLIYCFEPVPENAAMIRLNCPDAKVEQVAVGACRGRVTLYTDPDAVMASSIRCPWGTQAAEFDTISLDEFARAEALEDIALVKIDAEGMEIEILQGCHEVLKRTYLVVIETHSRLLHQNAISHLQQAGFSVEWQEFLGRTGLVFALRRTGGVLVAPQSRSALSFSHGACGCGSISAVGESNDRKIQ